MLTSADKSQSLVDATETVVYDPPAADAAVATDAVMMRLMVMMRRLMVMMMLSC